MKKLVKNKKPTKLRKYVLCLIDLQTMFDAATDANLLKHIKREVTAAIRANHDIMLVRYSGCGSIVADVQQMLKGYSNVYQVYKKWDGGGKEVSKAIIKRYGKGVHLRVGGVNTNACVQDTVIELADIFSTKKEFKRRKIQVVKKACWTDGGTTAHKRGIRNMDGLKRVTLV